MVIGARGEKVTVIGIVDGGVGRLGTNKWYRLLLTNGDTTLYYALVEWFGPQPPQADEHSAYIPTLFPTRTPRSVIMRTPTQRPYVYCEQSYVAVFRSFRFTLRVIGT